MEYYDRSGARMSREQWIATFEDHESKKVAHDEHDGVMVSTVWLGIDHQWGDGPPLIFETMIFGGPHDQAQWRDATEADALRTHEHACEVAFGGMAPGMKADEKVFLFEADE